MINDLISRSEFCKSLQKEFHGMISDESLKVYEIVRRINSQPTAYDVYKVIEALEYRKKLCSYSKDSDDKIAAYDTAIALIRNGGGE